MRGAAFLVAFAVLLTFGVQLPASDDDGDAAQESGPALGDTVPSFYVREVTARRPDLATCLVCRYGARPVVTVWVRKLDGQVEELLRRVDRAVDEARGEGLRGFAVFLQEGTHHSDADIVTLGRTLSLTMPLAVPVEVGGPASLHLSREASVTVVLHCNKRVTATHQFAEGDVGDEALETVLSGIRAMIE